MSATLTWVSSGLGAKTGTTRATYFSDLDTLITSKAGDATFSWQVASVSIAANPNYLVLKRKDGSAGRILLVGYTAAPAGANTTLFDVAAGSVLTTTVYIAWFPAGNVDTPSNLTAASGTILGDDTGAVKVAPGATTATAYAALLQHYYFDSAEGVVFCTQNPASTSSYMVAAGDLLVDLNDDAYGCTIGYGSSVLGGFGSSTVTSVPVPFDPSPDNAGTSTACIRTNYGSANRLYYHAFMPTGSWANVAVNSTDILTETSSNSAWFVPCPLVGNAKGAGFPLKYRQMGWGPGATGPLSTYLITGPTVAARQLNAATTGGTGFPWLTNFKL